MYVFIICECFVIYLFQNGLYSAIPYMSLFAVRMIAAFIADALVVHKVLSVKNIRKLMFGIGQFTSFLL